MNSFSRHTLIAALDIGSSKVCCVIARVNGRDKKISIVGYGYNAAKGIQNGVITNFNQATYSICDALKQNKWQMNV